MLIPEYLIRVQALGYIKLHPERFLLLVVHAADWNCIVFTLSVVVQ
jgi:hypothetical protein